MKPLSCCTDAFAIPQCPTLINAWQIHGVFTAVDFVVRISNNLNHIKYVTGTTGPLGEFIIDLSSISEGFFTTNFTYQMEVFVENLQNLFFIGGTTHECIAFCVEDGTERDFIQPVFKDIPNTTTMQFLANIGVEVNDSTTDVVRWNNSGSNGFDGKQPNNADRPTFDGSNKVSFDGSNALCADDPTLDLSGDYLHIMCRFRNTNKTAPVLQFQTLISQYDSNTGTKQSFALYIDVLQDIVFFDVIANNGITIKSRQVKPVLLLDTDVIMSGVFNAGETNIYIDGVDRALQAFQDNDVVVVQDLDTPLNIGANSNIAPGFTFAFAGDMYGAIIWTSPPTSAEWVYWHNYLNTI